MNRRCNHLLSADVLIVVSGGGDGVDVADVSASAVAFCFSLFAPQIIRQSHQNTPQTPMRAVRTGVWTPEDAGVPSVLPVALFTSVLLHLLGCDIMLSSHTLSHTPVAARAGWRESAPVQCNDCRGDPQARMSGRKGGSWCKSSAVPQL